MMIDDELLCSEMDLLLNVGKVGVWQLNLENDVLEVRGGSCVHNLLGRTSSHFSTKLDIFLKHFCSSDDRARILREIEKSKKEGQPFYIEHQIYNNNTDKWIWVSSHGQVRQREDGRYLFGGMVDIDTRKKYEHTIAALSDAEERLRAVFDLMPLSCTLWDESLNMIKCNQEALRLFRVPTREKYMDDFYNLMPHFQPDGRESEEAAREHLAAAYASGYEKFDWVHMTSDGEEVPSDVHLIKLNFKGKNLILGYVYDMREQMRMLEAVKSADERTHIMLDALPLGCNFWDENLDNIDCNEASPRMFGLSCKAEYLDRFFDLSPYFQPDGTVSRDEIKRVVAETFETGASRIEWMHQKLDGEEIPCAVTLVRVDRGNDKVVMAYTRDLREFKAMLADIHKKECELLEARDLAEKNARAKSDFLANMSHEIRTPMNAVLGMLHLLDNTELRGKQKELLESCKSSADLLLHIIDDILDFSKIEAGAVELEKVTFSLERIVKDVCKILDNQVKRKKLELTVDISSEIPGCLVGDPVRLKQILLNLANNAVKFTSNGSIHINVKMELATETNAYLLFEVSDSGVGMSKEQVSRLFMPFCQADSSVTRKFGGTGLGLVISKNLVELMGGEIWCESEPNYGTSFKFTADFMLADADDKGICKDSQMALDLGLANNMEVKDYSHLAGKKVLLVEDNELNQMITLEFLKMVGIEADIANNGLEGLEALGRNNYDLVLMDIQMPEMDGLTAASEIRSNPRYRGLPIIAMTAHAMSGHREMSLKSGMNDHLTKPVDPEKLFQCLEKWFAKSEQCDGSEGGVVTEYAELPGK